MFFTALMALHLLSSTESGQSNFDFCFDNESWYVTFNFADSAKTDNQRREQPAKSLMSFTNKKKKKIAL